MKTETITINISQDILAALKMGVNDRSKKQQKLGQLTRSEEVRKKLGLV